MGVRVVVFFKGSLTEEASCRGHVLRTLFLLGRNSEGDVILFLLLLEAAGIRGCWPVVPSSALQCIPSRHDFHHCYCRFTISGLFLVCGQLRIFPFLQYATFTPMQIFTITTNKTSPSSSLQSTGRGR